MNDRTNQPAELKRRIRQLEGQLEAEKQRADKAWENYRDALYELTEAKIKLGDVRRALDHE